MRLIDADAIIEVLSDKDLKECFLTNASGVIQLLKDTPTIEDNDLIAGMISNDYKERFKAEYKQLIIRLDKLYNYMNKNEISTEEIRPLWEQARAMIVYKRCLKERAKILKIKLERDKYGA